MSAVTVTGGLYLAAVLLVIAVFVWEERRPNREPEVVNFIAVLPPVPPSQRCDCDTWLEVWPTADDAEQAVFDKLCAEIETNFRVLGEAS